MRPRSPSINGSVGQFTITASNTNRELLLNGAGSQTARDVDSTARMAASVLPIGSGAEVRFAVLARAVSAGNLYRGVVRLLADGSVKLQVQKLVGNSESWLATGTTVPGLTRAANQYIRVRVEVTGANPTTIRMRAWADGSAEPTTWLVTQSDPQAVLQTAGHVGLRTHLTSEVTNAPITASWDDWLVMATSAGGGGGGTPTPTNTPTPTPGGGGSTTFVTLADSTNKDDLPTTNFGTSTSLEAEGGVDPDRQALMRFTVSGLSGTVTNAKVRVRVTTNDTVDGPTIYRAAEGWTETGVTWNNKPAQTSGALDDKGAMSINTWYEYDVTSQVTGNGTYSFVLVSGSTDGVVLSSREGTHPPELVVTTNSSPTPTNTPTPIPGATNTPTPTPTNTLVPAPSYNETYAYNQIGNLTSKAGVTQTYGTTSASCPGGQRTKPHGIVTSGGNSYCYDANGNMTQGGGRTYTWNAANQPTTIVGNGVTETYVYDADGTRVSRSVGGITTRYAFGLYEQEGAITRTYYSFGGQVIAVRDSVAGLSYLYGDHLGSVSASTNATGQLLSTQHFDAWGKKLTGSMSQTDRNYTGQYLDDTGLLFYNARYYDPGIGRFVSADWIAPGNASGGMDGIALKPLTVAFHEYGFVSGLAAEHRGADEKLYNMGPQNPQALNRYSYTLNNPVRYTDPSGHAVPTPTCPSGWCNTRWGNISSWNAPAKGAAVVGCFIIGCHIDNSTGDVTGPTTQEYTQSAVANMMPMAGVQSRALTAADLGIKGVVNELKGTFSVDGAVATVRIDYIEAGVANPFEVLKSLKNAARASGATTLRIEALLANEELNDILIKRYGLVTENGVDFIEVAVK